MSRIASTYQALARQERKALVTFVTAGDPGPAATPEIMHALVRHGADLLELGVPFSDPMVDGPAIQRANERALAQDVVPADVLAMVAQFRRADGDTPVLLMGYLNPIETFGYDAFAEQAVAAGVDGVIVVDLPPEEAGPLNRRLRDRAIDQVFLVTPNTGERRLKTIAGMASGFLYYVSVKGTTGGKQADVLAASEKLRLLRGKTDLPIAVGFGVTDAGTAAQLADHCDAVVIGSALVERVRAAAEAGEDLPTAIGAFLAPIRRSLDQAA